MDNRVFTLAQKVGDGDFRLQSPKGAARNLKTAFPATLGDLPRPPLVLRSPGGLSVRRSREDAIASRDEGVLQFSDGLVLIAHSRTFAPL